MHGPLNVKLKYSIYWTVKRA